jgi:hypothetical protein
MQSTLRLWGKKLARTPADQPAYLLEMLDARPRPRHTAGARLKNRR